MVDMKTQDERCLVGCLTSGVFLASGKLPTSSAPEVPGQGSGEGHFGKREEHVAEAWNSQSLMV